VENSSFLPWLTNTAFLHSIMIQEKRGMLRKWNVVLVVMSFLLAIFGTTLTRSGVIESVHSFAQSPVGPWFLTFFAVATGVTIYLVATRLRDLEPKAELESMVSREAAFLYNNLLLIGIAFAIFWGTVFPVLSEWATQNKITVGPPFFNAVNVPLGLLLLALTGIGPLIAWRKASVSNLKRQFATPVSVGIITGALLFALGMRSRYVLVAYALCGFVTGTIVQEFYKGMRARQTIHGESVVTAFRHLVARNRRRYGGYIVHASVVLLAIGVVGSNAYDKVSERTLSAGESMSIGHYGLTYNKLVRQQGANDTEFRALLDVRKNGNRIGTLESGKNSYPAEQQTSNEVGIRTDYLTGEDLFVITDQINPNGTIAFKVLVKPLVNLIWLAGVVFLIGSLVALWPSAVEQRRLADRYRELRAYARA
jgi:cytochrome c-type biogenesis protein CcmF